MTFPNRTPSHILPLPTHQASDRSDSLSPSPVPIRKRSGLSNMDVNRIPLTVNSSHVVGDSKPIIHKRLLPDTDTYLSENRPTPSEFQIADHHDHPHHDTQIHVQLLPSYLKFQQQPRRSHETMSTAQPQSDYQTSFSNRMPASDWSNDSACASRQNATAPENCVDLFSPLVISRTSSLNQETEECDPSAQTLAPVDQLEGEMLMYTCQFCRKTYQGRHARSIWRRHLSDKHKIPLATQPRRTRWDNADANRPQTDEERRERTLESKRRWARKNRAAKKAAREAQKLAEATGIAPEINADPFEATSIPTSPSHDPSASPISISNSRPPTSSASSHGLGVPSGNAGRSHSLQAMDTYSTELLQPTPHRSSAPYQVRPSSSGMPSDQTSSHNTVRPMPQFLPSSSFQSSAPISDKIQSFQQHHFSSAFGPQAVLGAGRAVPETLHQDCTPQQAHNLNSVPRDRIQSTPNQSFHLVNTPFYSQQPHQSLYSVPYGAAPVICPPQLNTSYAHGSSAPTNRTQENKSLMNGLDVVYDESGLKTDGGQSLYPMDLFDSPMSALRDHHQSTVSSSGGSVDQWSSLETPSDLPHHGRRDFFGFGTGHRSISSHSLFELPQESSFGKSLGLVSSGAVGGDECINGDGFLESAWDLNQL